MLAGNTIEMSALPGQFASEGYPYPSGQAAVQWTVEEIGSDKILWGSDVPGILSFCTYRQALDLVLDHCRFLTREQREAVVGGNATRLLRHES
ncbi:MAG: hypothetical protein FJ011_25320 [Chloroflexi bacterium]|nr:hypothetical protein [Chloroflexota bacterium]